MTAKSYLVQQWINACFQKLWQGANYTKALIYSAWIIQVCLHHSHMMLSPVLLLEMCIRIHLYRHSEILLYLLKTNKVLQTTTSQICQSNVVFHFVFISCSSHLMVKTIKYILNKTLTRVICAHPIGLCMSKVLVKNKTCHLWRYLIVTL